MSEADIVPKPAEAVEQPAAETTTTAEAAAPAAPAAAAEATEATESAPVEATESAPVEATESATVEATESAPAAANGQEEKKILKTTAKVDHDNRQKNNKFDPSQRGVTDDPVAIRKQVEFYFGDWNFPQDKFMWESCGGAENKPIPVEKIHSFKRMRTFQPYSAVVAALRDSKFLDVEGEEGKETLKRKVAYRPMADARAKNEASTVYVKGFGDETPNTQFDVESFFAQFGEIKGLKLRRTAEGLFKGSVFVTFVDEEAAKAFVAKDPSPKWKDEHDLKIMTKQAYCQEKSDLIRAGKLEPSSTTSKKFFEGQEGGGGGRRNGGGPRDSDDWKKRREHDQKNGFRGGRGGGRGGRGRGGRGGRGRGGFRGDRRRDGEEGGQNKRAREDDGNGAEEPAAKKVDTKEDA